MKISKKSTSALISLEISQRFLDLILSDNKLFQPHIAASTFELLSMPSITMRFSDHIAHFSFEQVFVSLVKVYFDHSFVYLCEDQLDLF